MSTVDCVPGTNNNPPVAFWLPGDYCCLVHNLADGIWVVADDRLGADATCLADVVGEVRAVVLHCDARVVRQHNHHIAVLDGWCFKAKEKIPLSTSKRLSGLLFTEIFSIFYR